MTPLKRNNVTIRGNPCAATTLVFGHGFGCDQNMWRFVAPAFEATHRIVLFDYVGCGKSDIAAYEPGRYATLDGYALDVVEVLAAAGLADVVFVGHSVSSMIGALASIRAPGAIGRLVMLGPSPRYLNDPPEYFGGFEASDIDQLIEMIESNMLGWASFLAPMVLGPGNRLDLQDELRASFCAIDPSITRRFAQATFLGDNRADLPKVRVPTLVVQMADDAITPVAIGEYVQRQLPRARLTLIQGVGHCPHMTHPRETIELIRGFLGESVPAADAGR